MAQVAPALTHLARVEALTGHMDTARALAGEALDLATQTEQDTYLDVALCALAHVCAYAGELDAARDRASDVLGRPADHPDVVLEGMAREVLGLAALQAGDLAAADRQFTRADQINDLVHNREPANQRFQADHVEAVIGLGDLDRAERLVARLEARAAVLPRPWILAVSARCRGMLHAAAETWTPRQPATTEPWPSTGNWTCRPSLAGPCSPGDGCTGGATSAGWLRRTWRGRFRCWTMPERSAGQPSHETS
jgi:ATP/maltotriose-dependent transcriptional regulator MalT